MGNALRPEPAQHNLWVTTSLVDWEMRSDRNLWRTLRMAASSLVDWEMRSDRNWRNRLARDLVSLVDWEMRSDRNALLAVFLDL